jgi:uncharacterized protein (DUF2062 family)
MIHLTKTLVRRWLDALLHVHDTPERTAAAFALGVFLGFSPFTTMIGAAILRFKLPPDLREQLGALFDLSLRSREFWHDLLALLRPLLWPYTVGSLIGAAVLAALAYRLALEFVIRRRRHHALHHPHNN